MRGPNVAERGEIVRRIGDEEWRGEPAALEALATAPAGAAVVKENLRRRVERVALAGGGAAFVKRFRDAGVAQTAKALVLGSRARREVEWARRLAAAGVRVAEPLAWGERRSFGIPRTCSVATRAIEGARPLIEVLSEPGLAADRRRDLLVATAALLRRVHDAGVAFRDFHLGNVLLGPDGRLALVDLQSAWSPPAFLLPRARVGNLAMALTSLPRSSWRAARRALRAYGRPPDWPDYDEPGVAKGAVVWAVRLVEAHLASRTRRCLRDSSAFAVERRGAFRVFRRREIPGAEAAALPAEADARLGAKGPGVLKDSPESAVVRGLALSGRAVVAKRYRPRGGIAGPRQALGWGRARRAWVAGNGLVVRGVDVASPLALLEEPGGGGWLLMEDLAEATPLDRFWATRAGPGEPALRRGLAEAVGRVLGAMHAGGAVHADLKACNVMVGSWPGGGIRVALVDYDRAAFRTPAESERVESLVQLGNSIPRAVPLRTRALCLSAYAQAAGFRGPSRTALVRRLARRVAAESARRGILWVGPEGDVRESWGGTRA
ncbi:MAG: hypothetical protein L0216_15905 [Planctomycetales bacterium]|nr:hypothetical protein [Planctomycetales bacterium]